MGTGIFVLRVEFGRGEPEAVVDLGGGCPATFWAAMICVSVNLLFSWFVRWFRTSDQLFVRIAHPGLGGAREHRCLILGASLSTRNSGQPFISTIVAEIPVEFRIPQ